MWLAGINTRFSKLKLSSSMTTCVEMVEICSRSSFPYDNFFSNASTKLPVDKRI